jgi:hypothetical protein
MIKYIFIINITVIIIKQYEGPIEVNETQKWATSKKRLRTTDLDDEFGGTLC